MGKTAYSVEGGPIDKRFIDENGKPVDNQLMERIFKLN
jgi:hypothetical protein